MSPPWRLAIAAAAAMTWALPTLARADPKPVIANEIPEHAIGFQFAYDPTWMVGLHYGHGWKASLGEHDARLDLGFDAPMMLIPTGLNWTLWGGFTGLFRVRGRFDISAGGRTGIALAKDVLGRKTSWMAELNLRPGYYDRRGSFSAHLGYRTSIVTWVKHSELVKATFDNRYMPGSNADLKNDEPIDGGYGFSSHRLRIGVDGGVQAAERVGFYFGAGYQWVPQPRGIFYNPKVGAWPFYADVGMDVRW
jgi:hypothetical protein